MKNSLLFLLVTLFSANVKAQVTIARPAEPQPVVIPYDSLRNFLANDYMGYVGQELYVKPRFEKLQKYGYEHFYTDFGKTTYRPADARRPRNTQYEALAEKTLKVIGASKARGIIGEEIYLTMTLDADTLYYRYDPLSFATFPFITVGYLQKKKNQNVGVTSILREVEPQTTDFRTGGTISLNVGSQWECTDIALDGQYLEKLIMVFANESGATFSIKEDVYDDYFIPESLANSIKVLYGTDWLECVLRKQIKKGMPGMVVRYAFGTPEQINKSSYGEQWVYKHQFVYLENDKVTGWN